MESVRIRIVIDDIIEGSGGLVGGPQGVAAFRPVRLGIGGIRRPEEGFGVYGGLPWKKELLFNISYLF